MGLHSSKELFELILAFKDITLFRLDISSFYLFDCLDGSSKRIPQVFFSFILKQSLALENIHLFLHFGLHQQLFVHFLHTVE